MMYYVFFAVAAVNLVAFISSVILYIKKSCTMRRYNEFKNYLKDLEFSGKMQEAV